MIEFEIYFHGLVCFYRPSKRGDDPTLPKTMALFVKDDEHHRSITTPDRIIRFPDFKNISMTVTGGITPGVIDATDGEFQSTVPHLGSDDISRTGVFVDPSLAIQLVFPPVAGRLFVAKPFDNPGEYQLGQRNSVRPVAKITALSIKADALSITCDGQSVEIEPQGGQQSTWVCLFNNSKEGGFSTVGDICGNHFRRYSFIMRNPTGDPANCFSIAHVVDHIVSPNPPTPTLNGIHIGTVAALPSVKPADEQPKAIPRRDGLQPLPRDGRGDDAGVSDGILDPDAALQFRNHADTITQTQCSNTNWP